MGNKEKMTNYIRKNRDVAKLFVDDSILKIIFFQNPCKYRLCHFVVENINPNHVFFVYVLDRHNKKHCGLVKVAKIIKS